MKHRLPRMLAAPLFIVAVAAAQSGSGARSGPFIDQQRADGLFERGKVGSARTVYLRLLEDMPASATLRYKIALCQEALGEPAKGVEHIQLALQFDPRMLPAQVLGAKLLARVDTDAALQWAKKALAQRELTGDMAVDLLEALGAAADVDRVAAVSKELVERFASDERLLSAAAEAALARHDLEFAEHCYEVWLRRNGRHPVALECLARVRALRGRDREAQRAYERLLEVNPSNLRGREALIDLLARTGADAEVVALQRRYLAHYRAVHAAAARNQDKDAKEGQR